LFKNLKSQAIFVMLSVVETSVFQLVRFFDYAGKDRFYF